MLEYFCRLRLTRVTTLGLTLALTVVPLLFAAPSVHAQLVNGYVGGTVTDQQKATVPEVNVTITNQDTQYTETKKTDAEGRYRFAAVPPGTYSVTFAKAGFQTQTAKNYQVTTSTETTVDRKMNVVGTALSVEVNAGPEAALSKSSASIQMTLPGRTLDLIPLSTSSIFPGGARNMGRFVFFAPGVVRVAGQNEFSAFGHRGRENNFMLDGVDNNDNTVTLPALFPPPEGIAEFQAQLATYSAEFGRNMGAKINTVTRNGTNGFHGEIWEFYRGNSLEPLSLQSRRTGLTSSPRLVDNQFGGDIGGPIIKNKTFFFGLIQGNRQRAPKPFGLVTIPTPAGLATLSAVTLRPAGVNPAQSAASRQSMLDALSFLTSVYPKINHYDSLSTVSVNGTNVEMGSYNPLVPMDQNFWYGIARIDHQITPSDRISYRVHIDDRNSPLSTGNLAFGPQWGADSRTLAQNHALSYTKNIGQNFVNEMRLSYTRLAPVFTDHDPVSPTVTLTNLFIIGGGTGFPQERLEQTYQFQNISTYMVNRHSFKFGLDQARTHLFNNSAFNSKGSWTFPNLQDFLNNQASQLVQLVSTPAVYSFTQLKQAYFFQDDIKVSRSLTVNLGMRYETTSVPLGYFGATDTSVLAMNVPGPAKRDTNNWAPRVGFAYSPTSSEGFLGTILGGNKTVVRGGFGMAYDFLFYNLLSSGPATNYPRTNTQTNLAATLVDVFPTLLPKTNIVTLGPTTNFASIPSDIQSPTTHYWSLSLQRQLKSSFIVELGYTGNRSYHLFRQGQANPGTITQAKADAVIAGCTPTLGGCQDPAGFPASPARLDPSIASRTLLEATGQSTYHAGYIQVDMRLAHGLQFGANYTRSTNISDSEEVFPDATATDGGIVTSSPQLPQDFLNRRGEKSRSVFDRPNRFTIHETYAIPFFPNASKFLKLVFADWQMSAYTELQSGQPFTITIGVDALGAGNTGTQPARPNLNAGGIMTPDPVSGNFRTFVIPMDGTGIVTAPHVTNANGSVTFLRNSMPVGGTLGRNTFRGPGYSNTNLSLMKRFILPKDASLEIRGDFLNLFNHDNFQNPVGNMSSTNFGKNIFVPLTDARQVLVGAKFRF